MACMRTVEEHARVIAGLLRPMPGRSDPARRRGGTRPGRGPAGAPRPAAVRQLRDGRLRRPAADDLTELPVTLPVSQDIPAGRTDAAAPAAGHRGPDHDRCPAAGRRRHDRARSSAPTAASSGPHRQRAGPRRARPDPRRGRAPRRRRAAGRHGDRARRRSASPPRWACRPCRCGGRCGCSCCPPGAELVRPGEPLRRRPDLRVERADAGRRAAPRSARPRGSQHFVTDDVDELRAALTAAPTRRQGVDLIVTSGGVSAGAYEVVKDALTGQGIEFAKVAMQPGMPQGAGRLHGRADGDAAGQPGELVRLVRGVPAAGDPRGHGPRGPHPSGRAPRCTERRRLTRRQAAVPARPPRHRGGHRAPWGGPGSHLLSWLAGADCMIVLGEDVTHLEAGEQVEVWLLA